MSYLEFFLNSITTSAVEKSNLCSSMVLVISQMFSNGGSIKCQHSSTTILTTLVIGTHRAVQRDRVDHVVVVAGELVPVFHHHVLHHLLDGVAVGEAGGVQLQAGLETGH